MVDETSQMRLPTGRRAPYCKGLMARTLMATGRGPSTPTAWRRAMERRLTTRGRAARPRPPARDRDRETRPREAETLIDVTRSGRRCATSRRRRSCSSAAPRGGQETQATELAAWLGITRVVSTDMARQVDARLLRRRPHAGHRLLVLEAAAATRVTLPRETDLSRVGFIEQTKAVAVGIGRSPSARSPRARPDDRRRRRHRRRVLERSRWKQAVVVEIVLAVKDLDAHRHTSPCATGRPAACACCGATSTTRADPSIQKYITAGEDDRRAGHRQHRHGRRAERRAGYGPAAGGGAPGGDVSHGSPLQSAPFRPIEGVTPRPSRLLVPANRQDGSKP